MVQPDRDQPRAVSLSFISYQSVLTPHHGNQISAQACATHREEGVDMCEATLGQSNGDGWKNAFLFLSQADSLELQFIRLLRNQVGVGASHP